MMATTADDAEDPGQGSADGALRAAADELEVRVQAGHGGAAREVPDGSADRQQPAQRDDERGHADVGDDEALERPEAGSEADADGQGDEPAEGEVRADAEDVGHPVGHEQRVGHGDEADQRPDRQVDVARHDDEDHAGGDDRDAGRLDRQRDHVGRLEELAAAQDVEGEQDQPEGEEHAEQPEIDLRLREQTAQRGPSGRLSLTRNRCRVGHVRHDGPLLVPGAKRPAPPGCPGDAGWIARSAVGDRYLQAAGAVAASTPLHRSALVICSASIATWRFSAVSGVGWRMNDLTDGPARGREVLGGEPGLRRDVGVDEAVRDRQGQVLRVRAELQRGRAGEPCPARWRS